jgi:hypothetical protein
MTWDKFWEAVEAAADRIAYIGGLAFGLWILYSLLCATVETAQFLYITY